MADNREEAIAVLDRLVELELAGAVRYTQLLSNDLRSRAYTDHALDAAANVRGAASCDRSWRRSDGNGWTCLVGHRGVGGNSPRIGGRYSTGATGSRTTGHRTLSKAAQARRRLEHIIGGVRPDKDSRRGNALGGD